MPTNYYPYFRTVADTPPTEGDSDLEAAAAPFVIHPMKLGSGTPDGSTYLRGDGAWASVVAAAGDFSTLISGASSIIADTNRVIGAPLRIADGGGVLTLDGVLTLI